MHSPHRLHYRTRSIMHVAQTDSRDVGSKCNFSMSVHFSLHSGTTTDLFRDRPEIAEMQMYLILCKM